MSQLNSLRAELKVIVSRCKYTMATQVAFAMMPFVDALMLGPLGSHTLAAANLVICWSWVFLALAMGVVMGLESCVGFEYGKGNKTAQKRLLVAGLWISLPLGLMVAVADLLTETVLVASQVDMEVAVLAQQYAMARAPGDAAFVALIAANFWLIGTGQEHRPFRYLIPLNILNVLLNMVLIYGVGPIPALGIIGAGLSTSVIRVLTLLLMLYLVSSTLASISSQTSSDPGNGWAIRQILRVGLIVGPYLTFVFGALLTLVLISAQLAPAATAAHGLLVSITVLLNTLPRGIAEGVTARMGQLLGARSEPRIALWAGLAFYSSIAVVLPVVLLGAMMPLLQGFGVERDILVIVQGALLAAIFCHWATGAEMIISGAWRAHAQVMFPAGLTVISLGIVAIPLAYLSALHWDLGPAGIWASLGTAELLIMLVLLARLPK